MKCVTNCQSQLFEELDELFVALSETLMFDGDLNMFYDDFLNKITLKVTFEQSIEGRFIFVDILLNDELVISSRYDDDNDDSEHVLKKPLDKNELEKIADAVSEIREELE